MRRKLLAPCLLAVGMLAGMGWAPAHSHHADTMAEPIKRFAFLPHVFVDLRNGLEHDGVFGTAYNIRECHTVGTNCLNGTLFQVAWSKRCISTDIGDVWEAGGLTTRVVGSFIKNARHGPRTLFVAKTDGAENSLYIFSRRSGLVGLIHDPGQRSSLASKTADADFLSALGSDETLKNNGYLASYLVGLGRIGSCTEPTSSDS